MKIGPQLPIHIASAYGLRPTQAPRAVMSTRPAEATASPLPFASRPQPANPGMASLIAGHVSRSVDFSAATSIRSGGSHPMNEPVAASAPLQLYIRAADKLEAALGVHLGRGIDVKG
jgi:hypothetical protein